MIRLPARTPRTERLLAILGVLLSASALGGLMGVALGLTEDPGRGRLPIHPGARRTAPGATAAPPIRVAAAEAQRAAEVAPATPAEVVAASPALPCVRGEVVDLAPGAGAAWVEALDPDGVRSEARLEAGRFRLALRGRAPWRVRAARDGASSTWSIVEGPRDGLRLELRGLDTLRGWVTGPEGALAGAQVLVDVDGGQALDTESGLDGAFALEPVAGASLRVRALFPGLAPASVAIQAQDRCEPGGARAAPPAPGPGGRRALPRRRGPAPERAFDSTPWRRTPTSTPSSATRCSWSSTPRAARSWRVCPTGCGSCPCPSPPRTSSEPGCEVEAAGSAGEPRAAPDPCGRLGGRVAAPPGAEIEVELRPHPPTRERFGFLATRFAAADGSFDFPAVPEGSYRVQAAWGDGTSAPAIVEVAPGGNAWVTLDRE
ncbi:MAG: carboxypeptidase-like regulatory domain-containing protein [Planctomycetota bacterium]